MVIRLGNARLQMVKLILWKKYYKIMSSDAPPECVDRLRRAD